MVSVYARGDNASSNVAMYFRFNGDSAANYDNQALQGQAAAATASEGFAGTAAQIGFAAANTAGANLFASAEVFIPHYAGSTNNKQTISLFALKIGTATTNMIMGAYGGAWRSNAAINQITLIPAAGNFVSGTRLTIHALGA